MLALKNGSYLGNLDKSVSTGHLVASLTSYHNASLFGEMHCHENPHLSFVLKGGSLEKRKNAEIERHPGKITFYHSGEFHQSTRLKDSTRHINLELQPQFLASHNIDENILAFAVRKNPDVKFLLLQICKELIADDKWSGISLEMILIELINRHAHLEEKRKDLLWLDKLDEILRHDFRERLSLDYLSHAVNMHPVTISRQFHKSHACTLGEYLRKLKVEKSLTLMKTSGYSLTDIAFECGFADQSHFIRTFKHHTGFLPHLYQKL